MSWFVQHRQDWIEESLRVYGFINRQHLMRKFGISQPLASTDLQRYQRDNPGAVTYNTHRKRYEINGGNIMITDPLAKEGGAAFPNSIPADGNGATIVYAGASMRDYFAAKAMQAIITAWITPDAERQFGGAADPSEVAERAFAFADAMNRARKIAPVIVLLLSVAACTASPTAPTSTTAAAASISPYRWELVAPGCAVATPAPSLTDVAPSSVVDLPDGGRRVFYAQGTARANGDQDFIGGDFRRFEKVWALCAWNRYTRGVNP